MSRKGENIYKRKDGRWEGRYPKERTPDGKVRYGSIYGKSYREVRERLTQMKGALTVCQSPGAELLFSDAVEHWLNGKANLLKQSSLNKYQNLLKSYILPYFGDTYVSNITMSQLDCFSISLLAERNLQKKTVCDVLYVVRAVLKDAAMQGASLNCTGKEIRVKWEQKPIRVLSNGEQTGLLRYLYGDSSLKSLGILLCLFTGIRLGELCALEWQDVLWEEGVISVHKTMQRIQVQDASQKTKVIVTSPKSTCSVRKIPLPENLLLLLSSQAEKDGFFLTGSTDKWIEPREMEYYFHKVTKECGIQDVHFHTLRHTFATKCIELGFDVKSLSEILGHSSISITMNRYVHPSMQLKWEYMQKLSEVFAVK